MHVITFLGIVFFFLFFFQYILGLSKMPKAFSDQIVGILQFLWDFHLFDYTILFVYWFYSILLWHILISQNLKSEHLDFYLNSINSMHSCMKLLVKHFKTYFSVELGSNWDWENRNGKKWLKFGIIFTWF